MGFAKYHEDNMEIWEERNWRSLCPQSEKVIIGGDLQRNCYVLNRKSINTTHKKQTAYRTVVNAS